MPLNDANLAAAVAPGPVDAGPNILLGEDLRETIVLRGYLEQPGLVTQAGGPLNQPAAGVTIWRLFLSPARDVYVDFTARDAIRVAPFTPNNPADGLSGAPTLYGGPTGAVTLWLTTVPANLAPPTPQSPRRYFISRALVAPNGFVSGGLLDDLMGSQEARVQAWPEQDYGQGWPKTTRTNPC